MDLLHLIEQDPLLKNTVFDLYGTFDMSFTGSGRPFFLMSKREKSEIEHFINKVHEQGLKFTWLWNGMCSGFSMFNSEQQSKALKELDWLEDVEVKFLTIADPYLAKFVKQYHPNLKLKVSVISEINCLSRALEWERIIGKEGVLTLSVMLNRNFPLLKEIKETVKCDIELLVNDCCLNECPFRFFHYTECSHASQDHNVLEGYYNDWAAMACQTQKALYPEQILMGKWIHPIDIDKYLEIGIDYFKISGRRYNTEWLARVLTAYAKKSYSGNLGNILNGYSFVADPLELAGGQFPKYAEKQEKIGGYPDDAGIMLSIPDFNAKLNAKKLQHFIETLPYNGAHCIENCGVNCTYCYNYVDKAYSLPSETQANSYKNYMVYLLEYLNHGEMFIPVNQRTLINPIEKKDSDSFFGICWTPQARELLEETMELIPDNMKKSAEKAIRHTSERTAEKKNSSKITQELLISVVIQLVPRTFKHDLLDFLFEKGINIQKFLSEEEINYIRSLPYGNSKREHKRFVNTMQKKDKTPKISEMRIETKEEWTTYLTEFMKEYNNIASLKPLLKQVAPIIFQFDITDHQEMNFWQKFDKDHVQWGIDEYSEDFVPRIIHYASFEMIRGVFSGDIDPIKATMDGSYIVKGDLDKLMVCAPLLPLLATAHAQISKT